MAEFPEIGAQCSYPSCRQLDFLPIKCTFCAQIFCTIHSFPEKHNCPEFKLQDKTISKNEDLGSPLYVLCEYKDCKEKEMTRITCPHCQLTTCLQHRHPKDHDCPSTQPQEGPSFKTKEHLNTLNLQSSKTDKRKLKTEKAKRTMARVQLMKLKMKSVGDKSIPTDDKIYFKLLRPREGPLEVFVSKKWSLGKALDSMASLAGLPNKNNDGSESKKLLLFHFEDGSLVRPFESMNIILEELLNQNELINGQTLIIDYSSGLGVEPSDYADV